MRKTEPKGLLVHHQMDKYMHCENPRRERKGAERLSEEIMAENMPNLMKDMNLQIKEA